MNTAKPHTGPDLPHTINNSPRKHNGHRRINWRTLGIPALNLLDRNRHSRPYVVGDGGHGPPFDASVALAAGGFGGSEVGCVVVGFGEEH